MRKKQVKTMLVDVLKKNIGVGKPIFSQKIIRLYPNYSRAQVYRYIKDAISSKLLRQYSNGIYYIPEQGLLGEIIESKFYKRDYNSSTINLLIKPVAYEEAIKGVKKNH